MPPSSEPIAVIRVTVLSGAAIPFYWDVRGLLEDIKWPVKLGAESKTSFLVSAADVGLSAKTCATYKRRRDRFHALLEYYKEHPGTFDHEYMEELGGSIGAVGQKIHRALAANFPRWRASLETAERPPWAD